MRGNIYDRKYRPVAVNSSQNNLYFRISRIKDKGDLAAFISKHFDIDSLQVLEIISENRFRLHSDIPLQKGLNMPDLIRIGEDMHNYPSLEIISEYSRYYEYPNHFTGHTGPVSEKEFLSLQNEGYDQSSYIGKNGLEKQYEELLRGKTGYRLIQVDATGKNLEFLKHNLYIPPEKGLDLILTIDNDLQNYIRMVFPPDKRGAVAVMDVRSGGILAYVSLPEFDQNIFSGEISRNRWNELVNDPAKPMLDRVSNGVYPPGSTYKTVIASLGLESNVITPDTKLAYCDGGMQVGNRYFKCWWEEGHGRLAVSDAIKRSCDVFFYDLSLKLDLADMKNFTEKNHLTVKTGVDLPLERKGFFPTEKWYYDNYGRYTGIIGPKVNLAIGQGELQVTVLELCAYYSALANDGLWLQPYFLEGYLENERYELAAKTAENLPLSIETLQLLQDALFRAVNEPFGTGWAAAVKGVNVYGKTGSAENHMGEDTHAWFSGYAAWEEPEIALAIIIENSGHGGSVAAPVARKIINFYDKLRSGNPQEYMKLFNEFYE